MFGTRQNSRPSPSRIDPSPLLNRYTNNEIINCRLYFKKKTEIFVVGEGKGKNTDDKEKEWYEKTE